MKEEYLAVNSVVSVGCTIGRGTLPRFEPICGIMMQGFHAVMFLRLHFYSLAIAQNVIICS